GLARSITAGQGYQFNDRIGSRYPPVLPIILAGLIFISQQADSVFSMVALAKIVQVALALLMAVGGWRLANHYLDQRLSALVGLLIWSNLCLFQHSMFILSDVLYGCLSIWGLILLQDKVSRKRFVSSLILISLAWLTRSVGMLLVAALAAGIIFSRPQMFQGKWRWIWGIIAPVICIAPNILWKTVAAGSDGEFYLTWWIAESGQNNLPMAILTG
ncbi:MAG: glycosyltransferase family 39 protein, partial [Planctomycetes bacterium]|nr:glycosyltransferase family 39 protein [Planctomycetota bacterium]